jgi:hypothetical protein
MTLERCNESSIDMTEAPKPSELFGLRWRSLDDQNALPLYRNGVAANALALRQDSRHLTKFIHLMA